MIQRYYNDNCSNYWLDSTYYTFHTCDRIIVLSQWSTKHMNFHLPKEKWTWLHFLPSSEAFLTHHICGWIQIALRNLPLTQHMHFWLCPTVWLPLGIWHQAQVQRKAGIEKGFQRQWTVWPAGSELVASGPGRVSQGQTAGVPCILGCSALCKRQSAYASVFICGFSQLSLFIKADQSLPWNPGSWAEQCNWENNRASVAQKDYCWRDINRLFGLWAQIHFVICWPLLTRLPKPVTLADVVFRFPEELWMWLMAVTMAVGSVLLCSWTLAWAC